MILLTRTYPKKSNIFLLLYFRIRFFCTSFYFSHFVKNCNKWKAFCTKWLQCFIKQRILLFSRHNESFIYVYFMRKNNFIIFLHRCILVVLCSILFVYRNIRLYKKKNYWCLQKLNKHARCKKTPPFRQAFRPFHSDTSITTVLTFNRNK